MEKARPAFKLWLETDEGYVFGPGVYNLLIKIQEAGTLKQASADLGMSYRYAWGLLKKAEEKLGEPLIEATKGGRQGGGSTQITILGEHFIDDFEKIMAILNQASQGIMDLKLRGKIVNISSSEEFVEVTVQLPVSSEIESKTKLGGLVDISFNKEE